MSAAMPAAMRAEWVKLRTVTGPAWGLAGMIALTVAVSVAVVAADRCPAGTACQVDTTKMSLSGILLGQAVVAILAVLPVCNEYSTGMIRVTLSAMPRRTTVLATKTVLVAALVLIGSALAVLGCVFAGHLILSAGDVTPAPGIPALSLASGPTLRAAAGSVLYLGLIAVLSVGIAAIVRDPAPTIGLVLGVLYLSQVVDAFVANPTWHNRIERYSPMAGLNIQATTNLKSLAISPWAGLGVLAIWAAAIWLAGALVLRLRDA